jgi:hypothetical protein
MPAVVFIDTTIFILIGNHLYINVTELEAISSYTSSQGEEDIVYVQSVVVFSFNYDIFIAVQTFLKSI